MTSVERAAATHRTPVYTWGAGGKGGMSYPCAQRTPSRGASVASLASPRVRAARQDAPARTRLTTHTTTSHRAGGRPLARRPPPHPQPHAPGNGRAFTPDAPRVLAGCRSATRCGMRARPATMSWTRDAVVRKADTVARCAQNRGRQGWGGGWHLPTLWANAHVSGIRARAVRKQDTLSGNRTHRGRRGLVAPLDSAPASVARRPRRSALPNASAALQGGCDRKPLRTVAREPRTEGRARPHAQPRQQPNGFCRVGVARALDLCREGGGCFSNKFAPATAFPTPRSKNGKTRKNGKIAAVS